MVVTSSKHNLLGAGVFGDGLGSLRDGVLGQLPGQQEPHRGLDLPGGDGGPLVVVGQAGSFSSDTLKDIVDEGVHDAHGLAGNTSIGVNLLQHLVDVDSVRFTPLLPSFLITLGDRFLGLTGLLGSLSGGFRGHVVDRRSNKKRLFQHFTKFFLYTLKQLAEIGAGRALLNVYKKFAQKS